MARIREVKPAQIITIDDKLEVREISTAVISRIEHSREWEEHRRTHKNAQLAVKSDSPAELKPSLSKAVREFYEQFKPSEEVAVRETPKPAGMMYGSRTTEGPVHVYSAPSEVSAGCTCGQSFKLDPQGNVVTGKGGAQQGAAGGGPGAYSVGAKEGGYAGAPKSTPYAVSGKQEKSLYK